MSCGLARRVHICYTLSTKMGVRNVIFGSSRKTQSDLAALRDLNEQAAELTAELAVLAKNAQIKAYADGVTDGMRTTLKLLTGAPTDCGDPCPQPIPSPVRKWAENALGNISRGGSE